MTLPSYRAAEPLYVVILRNQQAENLLRTWVREHKIDHATVSGNKMMIHHQSVFDRFLISWTHSWDLVTVWDTWNRRHIYV